MTLDLRLERWVPAKPARVFDAFTDIDELRSWFTCDPSSTWTFHTWDATVGGQLQVTISGDGYAMEVHGRFVTVERPNRLAYDWDDELVALDFRPQDGGTLIVLHHQRLATDTDVQIRNGGWTHNLGSLAGHLTTAKETRT
ncbi:MAG: SRPBCC domain-containing protein [Acidimicrobiia bacterium]|nr:SRPBCC domain-containing protein [Acidimicrobiia bacterium]